VGVEELEESESLGFAPRPGAGVGSVVFEEVREGRADVDAAGAVLVVLAVAVVVDALGVELVDALLALGPVGPLEDAGRGGDGEVFAFGVLDAHLGDEAVAVEVLGAVLVDRVVLVVVRRARVARVEAEGGRGRREETRGGVGIAAGQDVPGAVGTHVGLVEEEPGEVEGGLRGERDRAFHVRGDKDRGEGFGRGAGLSGGRQRGAGDLGADLEDDELAAAGAFGERVDAGDSGIGAGDLARGRGELLGLMVAVEGQPADRGGGR